tara:strand:+ start:102 stop:1214 length:1113 start_codon:yes stop_codon:yes gene_type:complete
MKIRIFINFFSNILESIFHPFNEKSVFLFFQSIRESLSDNANYGTLTEFKIFPKRPKRLYPCIFNKKNVSIIIEGEIKEHDFIQETINWYKNCGIKNIILSTTSCPYKFLNCKTISKFENKIKGIFNENNKLENIKNALFHIHDDDLVIKTRTDQRIYSEIFLTNIIDFHESNQSYQECCNSKMGVISTNSSLIKINNISDHLYIDYAYKLKKMFNLNYRKGSKLISEINSYSKSNFDINKFRGELSSAIFTEFESGQWFLNSYRRNCLEIDKSEKPFLKKEDYISSLFKYLKFIENSIYVIDPEDIELFWLKKNINKYPFDRYQILEKNNPVLLRDLTRLNWLCLINDENYCLQIIENAKTFSFNDLIF